MPTTKPKNKKPVAVQSGGRVPGKGVKKTQKADTPAVKEKKPPLKAAPPPIPMIGNQSGSLLGNYPPGFENDGKRLLAECPEFKLWELYHEGGPQKLETVERILHAERKALFRIKRGSDGSFEKGEEEEIYRVNRAMALFYLVRFKELGCEYGAVPVAKRMAESFVPFIKQAMSSDDPETAADRAGKIFKGAVLSLAREAGKLNGKKPQKYPRVAMLIHLAQGSFQYTQIRPKKSELRANMERLGYSFMGKDLSEKWRELFRIAGLEELTK